MCSDEETNAEIALLLLFLAANAHIHKMCEGYPPQRKREAKCFIASDIDRLVIQY